MGIDAMHGFLGRLCLGPAHVGVRVQNLALQIGIIHRVEIHDADLPMPAAARYMAMGEPRPPAPMHRTLVALIFFWPARPTSGRIRCRE
jgi:hypothetical protein